MPEPAIAMGLTSSFRLITLGFEFLAAGGSSSTF